MGHLTPSLPAPEKYKKEGPAVQEFGGLGVSVTVLSEVATSLRVLMGSFGGPSGLNRHM